MRLGFIFFWILCVGTFALYANDARPNEKQPSSLNPAITRQQLAKDLSFKDEKVSKILESLSSASTEAGHPALFSLDPRLRDETLSIDFGSHMPLLAALVSLCEVVDPVYDQVCLVPQSDTHLVLMQDRNGPILEQKRNLLLNINEVSSDETLKEWLVARGVRFDHPKAFIGYDYPNRTLMVRNTQRNIRLMDRLMQAPGCLLVAKEEQKETNPAETGKTTPQPPPETVPGKETEPATGGTPPQGEPKKAEDTRPEKLALNEFILKQDMREADKILKNRKYDVNVSDRNGITPFMAACVRGNEKLMKTLIKRKANINALDKDSNHALHYAVLNDQPAVVKFLLAKKVPVDILNKSNETPLMIACRMEKENVEMVRILLKKRPKLGLKNLVGDTALSIAKEKKYEDVVKLLKRAGAKE